MVNYSVGLRLGFVTTVEVYTNNDDTTPDDTLKSFKGAWCLGVGLGGLGLLVTEAHLVKELL